ncbi:VOC family protein [Phenylobacterium sp.]|uniref:VOC family protein n=1 Tax=Phenylobacterium sp. TaxID=1871053 RepID=UPI001208497F|nr:VOC family protein [Phenylobacterium sp.]THD59056.1 MAG: VOC family protein [Phenylobacterium sp.]
MFTLGAIDHVGIRVSDRARAQAFYERLGFVLDPDEDSPGGRSIGLVNGAGARINLIYNAAPRASGGNVLMDIADKWPGYTHAAFLVASLDELVVWLEREGLRITEGPSVFGQGRRKVCFIRDPDGNVLEFDEIL